MTIYAVTDGVYSDYHIVALTVNKERAEHIAKFYADSQIEEYEDAVELPENPMWQCNIHNSPYEQYDYAYMTDKYNNPSAECVMGQTEHRGPYLIYARAEDEAHALKKARDMLAKYKAEQEGIT